MLCSASVARNWLPAWKNLNAIKPSQPARPTKGGTRRRRRGNLDPAEVPMYLTAPGKASHLHPSTSSHRGPPQSSVIQPTVQEEARASHNLLPLLLKLCRVSAMISEGENNRWLTASATSKCFSHLTLASCLYKPQFHLPNKTDAHHQTESHATAISEHSIKTCHGTQSKRKKHSHASLSTAEPSLHEATHTPSHRNVTSPQDPHQQITGQDPVIPGRPTSRTAVHTQLRLSSVSFSWTSLSS
ncbi:uncharacterized protein CLUP02_01127 [Colletotrichum lupini]|uniref:Uncharacterized protein n=1 Tax=Colletotrichum lupini TaxID=145971 RepID=A0A9Q8SBQ1_9PEZI|nr:uncharacterized protein CLUP02_01127 [Colletotrichum lupini]UQC74476.1 hypothetical protein CLUP02_01127 [Colletotrichum lupini]